MSGVRPVFKDNIENESILSGDTINMISEIPDANKYYASQEASSVTKSGANFQFSNLNSWIQGEIEMVFERKLVLRGQTIDPTLADVTPNANGNSFVGLATSPCLFNPLNHTIDGFGLNKSIQEIKYNVGNKAWTESDRTVPSMIDIYATQFSRDAVKSAGIYCDGGLSGRDMIHLQSYVLGQNTVQVNPAKAGTWGDVNKGYLVGMGVGRNDYPNRESILNQPTCQNVNQESTDCKRTGYVVVKDVKFTGRKSVPNGASLPVTLGVQYDAHDFVGIPVPYDTSIDVTLRKNNPFYSVDNDEFGGTSIVEDISQGFNGYLEQEVTLEIHEFIVSPFLSNPYSKNPHKKVYYTNGYPLNIQIAFNTTYIDKSLLKWCKSGWAYNQDTNIGNSTPPAVNPQVDLYSVPNYTKTELITNEFGSCQMRLWTFDSAKPLPKNPVRTLYYKADRQPPVISTSTRQGNGRFGLVNSQKISTSNLASLPPYIIVSVSCTPDLNPTYFGPNYTFSRDYDDFATTNFQTVFPYTEMCNIEKLELQIGTQNDTLGSCNLSKEALVQMTLNVLQNDELREVLSASQATTNNRSLGTHSGVMVTDFLSNDYRQRINTSGFPFYIIDMASLNLRSVDNVPLIPQINYGSTHFKSITINADWIPTEQMNIGVKKQHTAGQAPVLNDKIVGELNVVLMEQRIKTLPLFSGMMTDDKVEFNIDDVQSELLASLNDVYSTNGTSGLQYVGGAFAPFDFMKNLGRKAMSFVHNKVMPVAKNIVDASRLVKDYTEDSGLDGINKHATTISDIGKSFGLGKKGGRYSRA